MATNLANGHVTLRPNVAVAALTAIRDVINRWDRAGGAIIYPMGLARNIVWDALAQCQAEQGEVERLRALVQQWRFTAHPWGCECKTCTRTREELPDLPYYPDHGLRNADVRLTMQSGPPVPPLSDEQWAKVEEANRNMEEKWLLGTVTDVTGNSFTVEGNTPDNPFTRYARKVEG